MCSILYHSMAHSACHSYQLGNTTFLEFLRVSTLVNSKNYEIIQWFATASWF